MNIKNHYVCSRCHASGNVRDLEHDGRCPKCKRNYIEGNELSYKAEVSKLTLALRLTRSAAEYSYALAKIAELDPELVKPHDRLWLMGPYYITEMLRSAARAVVDYASTSEGVTTQSSYLNYLKVAHTMRARASKINDHKPEKDFTEIGGDLLDLCNELISC